PKCSGPACCTRRLTCPLGFWIRNLRTVLREKTRVAMSCLQGKRIPRDSVGQRNYFFLNQTPIPGRGGRLMFPRPSAYLRDLPPEIAIVTGHSVLGVKSSRSRWLGSQCACAKSPFLIWIAQRPVGFIDIAIRFSVVWRFRKGNSD